MDCPFCSQEMKKGFIQSSHMIAWTPKKAKLFLSVFNPNSVILAESFFSFASAEAFCCDKCKKVIVDYSTET